MVSTKDVLDHHLKCFGEGDLEGILSDYARGSRPLYRRLTSARDQRRQALVPGHDSGVWETWLGV